MLIIYFQVRDYIHVVDLADGHIAAVRKLDDTKIGIDFVLSFWWCYVYVYILLVLHDKINIHKLKPNILQYIATFTSFLPSVFFFKYFFPTSYVTFST